MKRGASGLTLLDVAVLVCVAAVLITLFMSWPRGHGEFSPRKACASNLKQIVAACITYQEPNGEFLPAQSQYGFGIMDDFKPMPSLAILYPDYIDNPRVFSCPSTKDETRISVVEHEGARWVCFGADKKEKPVANPVQYSGKELTTNQKCSYFYDERTHFRDVGPGQAIAADADGFNFLLPDGSSPPYPANWSRKPGKPNHDTGQNVMYFDGSVRWAQNTPYASDDPLDNIFCPNGNAAEKTPWGSDTDAYLWDGVNAQGIQWE